MVCKYMQVERDNARTIVESIIDAEEGYLFTNDMDYITNRTNVIPKDTPQTMDPEKILICELRNRIDSYFAITLRNVRDSVPKAVGHFLVRATQDNLQFSLYNHINKNKTLMNLLNEPANVTMERETMQKTLDVLSKAARLLKKDPDLGSAFFKTEKEEDDDESPKMKPQQQNQKRADSSNPSANPNVKMTVTEPKSTNQNPNNFMDFSNIPQKQPQQTNNLTVQQPTNNGGLSPSQGNPSLQPGKQATTTANNISNPSLFGNPSNSLFGGSAPNNKMATQPTDPKAAGTNNTLPSAGGNNPFQKR
jgi:hypothetical protein